MMLFNARFARHRSVAAFALCTCFILYCLPVNDMKDKQECSKDAFLAFLISDSKLCEMSIPWPSHVNRRRGVWQVAKEDGMEMVLYTAHLDPRLEYDGVPGTIRITGVGSHDAYTKLYCRLWYKELGTSVSTLALPSKGIGSGLYIQGVRYMEYLYTCPLSTVAYIPSHVSLSLRACSEVYNMIPVHIPNGLDRVMTRIHDLVPCNVRYVPQFIKGNISYEHEFGVCVPVAFGKPDPVELAEWFELNKILGVTEVTMFTSNFTGSSNKILRHYRNAGFLRHRSLPPPVEQEQGWPRNLNTIPALNRCLYDNMYRYRYLVIMDFDENVIPQKHYNYHELLSSLQENLTEQKCGWLFYNTYFWLDFPPDAKAIPYLRTARFIRHADISPMGYSTKSFTNPRRCVAHTNHYCDVRTKDTSKRLMRYVDPKIAKLHHYKKCHFTPPECAKSVKYPHYDVTAQKYAKDLSQRVKSILTSTGIWDKTAK